MNNRGMLTQEIINKYNFTQKELRLMPYVQYCCINNECIDPRKIDSEEREIINNWKSNGFISGGMSTVVCISYEFWNIIHDCLWYAYANQLEKEINNEHNK